MLMGGGKRDGRRVASCAPRAGRETRQDLHVELGLLADEYQGTETGTRLAGERKDSGWIYNAYEVDLQSGKRQTDRQRHAVHQRMARR